MRSEEFFNILDDMDEGLVSEIYEDVQRPQKLAPAPRSPRRLPKLILSGAACVAVIAAAVVTMRFALPGRTASLPTVPAANNGSSVTSESSVDWFSEEHLKPWVEQETDYTTDKTEIFTPDKPYIVQNSSNMSPCNAEIRASDGGIIIFAGKISDAYGSGVIIRHAENAYVAYGGLDPDSITVSEGDTVMPGDVFARSKAYSCMGGSAITVADYMGSRQPITDEYFRQHCEGYCYVINHLKHQMNEVDHGAPDPDGTHHIAANAGDEIKALEYGAVEYAGTDSDGKGMVIVNHGGSVYCVYKGLDTTFPDYYTEGDHMPNQVGKEETIGYAGSSDVYWFVLDLHEFEKFAQENNIATDPSDMVTSTNN